jgi:serine/threonine protein kinase
MGSVGSGNDSSSGGGGSVPPTLVMAAPLDLPDDTSFDWQKLGPPPRPIENLGADSLLAAAPRTRLQNRFQGQLFPRLKRYPLIAKLDKGGMGCVYLGIHPGLQNYVAVKILLPWLESEHPELAARMVNEAATLDRIKSPHAVEVKDRDKEGQLHFIVMEFVDGISAFHFWKQGLDAGRPGLPESDALEICIAATHGLATAHERKVVHRDVKPGNILLPRRVGKEGYDLSAAKLVDFGLALTEAFGHTTRTRGGMGTPGFMSPEQEHDARNVDQRTDVFAMGATLYLLLSGRKPLPSEEMETDIALLNMARDLPQDVSERTRNLLHRCLQRSPRRRYKNGEKLLKELEKCARPERGRSARKHAVEAERLGQEAAHPVGVAGPPTPQAMPSPEPQQPVDQSALTRPLTTSLLSTSGQARSRRGFALATAGAILLLLLFGTLLTHGWWQTPTAPEQVALPEPTEILPTKAPEETREGANTPTEKKEKQRAEETKAQPSTAPPKKVESEPVPGPNVPEKKDPPPPAPKLLPVAKELDELEQKLAVPNWNDVNPQGVIEGLTGIAEKAQALSAVEIEKSLATDILARTKTQTARWEAIKATFEEQAKLRTLIDGKDRDQHDAHDLARQLTDLQSKANKYAIKPVQDYVGQQLPVWQAEAEYRTAAKDEEAKDAQFNGANAEPLRKRIEIVEAGATKAKVLTDKAVATGRPPYKEAAMRITNKWDERTKMLAKDELAEKASKKTRAALVDYQHALNNDKADDARCAEVELKLQKTEDERLSDPKLPTSELRVRDLLSEADKQEASQARARMGLKLLKSHLGALAEAAREDTQPSENRVDSAGGRADREYHERAALWGLSLANQVAGNAGAERQEVRLLLEALPGRQMPDMYTIPAPNNALLSVEFPDLQAVLDGARALLKASGLDAIADVYEKSKLVRKAKEAANYRWTNVTLHSLTLPFGEQAQPASLYSMAYVTDPKHVGEEPYTKNAALRHRSRLLAEAAKEDTNRAFRCKGTDAVFLVRIGAAYQRQGTISKTAADDQPDSLQQVSVFSLRLQANASGLRADGRVLAQPGGELDNQMKQPNSLVTESTLEPVSNRAVVVATFGKTNPVVRYLVDSLFRNPLTEEGGDARPREEQEELAQSLSIVLRRCSRQVTVALDLDSSPEQQEFLLAVSEETPELRDLLLLSELKATGGGSASRNLGVKRTVVELPTERHGNTPIDGFQFEYNKERKLKLLYSNPSNAPDLPNPAGPGKVLLALGSDPLTGMKEAMDRLWKKRQDGLVAENVVAGAGVPAMAGSYLLVRPSVLLGDKQPAPPISLYGMQMEGRSGFCFRLNPQAFRAFRDATILYRKDQGARSKSWLASEIGDLAGWFTPEWHSSRHEWSGRLLAPERPSDGLVAILSTYEKDEEKRYRLFATGKMAEQLTALTKQRALASVVGTARAKEKDGYDVTKVVETTAFLRRRTPADQAGKEDCSLIDDALPLLVRYAAQEQRLHDEAAKKVEDAVAKRGEFLSADDAKLANLLCAMGKGGGKAALAPPASDLRQQRRRMACDAGVPAWREALVDLVLSEAEYLTAGRGAAKQFADGACAILEERYGSPSEAGNPAIARLFVLVWAWKAQLAFMADERSRDETDVVNKESAVHWLQTSEFRDSVWKGDVLCNRLQQLGR